jgi:hypothetical protein
MNIGTFMNTITRCLAMIDLSRANSSSFDSVGVGGAGFGSLEFDVVDDIAIDVVEVSFVTACTNSLLEAPSTIWIVCPFNSNTHVGTDLTG